MLDSFVGAGLFSLVRASGTGDFLRAFLCGEWSVDPAFLLEGAALVGDATAFPFCPPDLARPRFGEALDFWGDFGASFSFLLLVPLASLSSSSSDVLISTSES